MLRKLFAQTRAWIVLFSFLAIALLAATGYSTASAADGGGQQASYEHMWHRTGHGDCPPDLVCAEYFYGDTFIGPVCCIPPEAVGEPGAGTDICGRQFRHSHTGVLF